MLQKLQRVKDEENKEIGNFILILTIQGYVKKWQGMQTSEI